MSEEPRLVEGRFFCPRCNTLLKMDSSILLSNPPQYKYRCLSDNCKYEYTSTSLIAYNSVYSGNLILKTLDSEMIKQTNINDLDGISLAYACCVAKGLNIKLVNYSDKYGVEEDDKVFSLNARKHFKLSFVLPHLKRLNAVTFKLDSGWLAETNCGTIFTAQTFFEVVAKAFVFIKVGRSTISVSEKILQSNELADLRYFCSEDEF